MMRSEKDWLYMVELIARAHDPEWELFETTDSSSQVAEHASNEASVTLPTPIPADWVD